ncbi:hypothetical protein RvY_19014 [Ramazzottius varieornatus]|uniref:Uncharacterized protein n=1 Tax=Ramazzottius varieornatus TaxID=947166 RepID=A0A1D1W7W1_RAMVA|nr:hypothetical protein RvY_19014 [Ramazzottius varieornatus]
MAQSDAIAKKLERALAATNANRDRIQRGLSTVFRQLSPSGPPIVYIYQSGNSSLPSLSVDLPPVHHRLRELMKDQREYVNLTDLLPANREADLSLHKHKSDHIQREEITHFLGWTRAYYVFATYRSHYFPNMQHALLGFYRKNGGARSGQPTPPAIPPAARVSPVVKSDTTPIRPSSVVILSLKPGSHLGPSTRQMEQKSVATSTVDNVAPPATAGASTSASPASPTLAKGFQPRTVQSQGPSSP